MFWLTRLLQFIGDNGIFLFKWLQCALIYSIWDNVSHLFRRNKPVYFHLLQRKFGPRTRRLVVIRKRCEFIERLDSQFHTYLQAADRWGSGKASINKDHHTMIIIQKAAINIMIDLAAEGQVACKKIADQWRNCRRVFLLLLDPRRLLCSRCHRTAVCVCKLHFPFSFLAPVVYSRHWTTTCMRLKESADVLD